MLVIIADGKCLGK